MIRAVFEVLLSPGLPLALLWYLGGMLVTAALLRAGDRWLASVRPSYWILEHVLLPALQAFLLLGFLLLLYPTLFGLPEEEAPPLIRLFERPGRFASLINWLVVLSVVAAMLPRLARHLNWIVPLQGMLMVAMLFHDLARVTGMAEHRWWPDGGTMLAVILLNAGGVWLAGRLSFWLAPWLDARLGVQGMGRLLQPALALACQVPALAVYGHALARQLA